MYTVILSYNSWPHVLVYCPIILQQLATCLGILSYYPTTVSHMSWYTVILSYNSQPHVLVYCPIILQQLATCLGILSYYPTTVGHLSWYTVISYNSWPLVQVYCHILQQLVTCLGIISSSTTVGHMSWYTFLLYNSWQTIEPEHYKRLHLSTVWLSKQSILSVLQYHHDYICHIMRLS